MTDAQITDLILGGFTLVPPLLILAGWLWWTARRDTRAREAVLHSMRHWIGGE